MTTNTDFLGDWMRQQRHRLGYTQEQLAELVGCSVESVRKIETGARRPSRQIAVLLAEHLRVPEESRAEFVRLARNLASTSELEAALPGTPNGSASGLASHPPAPVPALSNTNSHAPLSLTSLIGRDEAMGQVRAMLERRGVRLLTLTGPPGIGKTRLAMEVARAVEAEFPDGVHFVPLAAISDPELVVTTVARSLGLVESAAGSPVRALAVALGDKRALLVLDNFEQVLPAAPVLTDLLALCPGLTVLVTSQAALRVSGEWQFPVPPLDVPATEHTVGSIHAAANVPPDIASVPSVALFVERAQAVKPDFELTPENAGSVAAICRQLDGLPLALELAAARTRLFPVGEILVRLGNRLKLLGGGARDMPARHQTLRAAIDWSYNLLDAGEQALFARIGVFVGGCTLAAIESVCDARDDLPLDVLDGVGSLLDKNLLRQEGDLSGETRLTMLETIREYARERLAERGEEADLRRLHAEYYLALAESAAAEMVGPDVAEWMERLDREHDNMRSAVRWARESGKPDMELRLVGALYEFWHRRSYINEGRQRLEAALASQPGAEHTPQRAKALVGAAIMGWMAGDLPAARVRAEEGLQVAREVGDKRTAAYALGAFVMYGQATGDPETGNWTMECLSLFREVGDNWGRAWYQSGLGLLFLEMGQIEQAKAALSECLSLFQTTGDPWGTSLELCFLGHVEYRQGNYEAARALYVQSRELYRQVGDRWRVAWQTCNLAHTALMVKQYDEAVALYHESLAGFLECGHAEHIGALARRLGHVARKQGHYDEAWAQYMESLSRYRELEGGWKVHSAKCLEDLAGVLVDRGEIERAAVLYGAASTVLRKPDGTSLYSALGAPLFSPEWDEADIDIVAARAQLGEDAFRQSYAEGRAMDLEAAVKHATS